MAQRFIFRVNLNKGLPSVSSRVLKDLVSTVSVGVRKSRTEELQWKLSNAFYCFRGVTMTLMIITRYNYYFKASFLDHSQM